MTLNHTLRPCKRSPTSLTQLENGASKSTLFSVHKKVNKKKKGKRFQNYPMVLAVPAASLRRLDHLHDIFPCSSHRDLSFKSLRTPAGSTRLENRPTKPGHLGQGTPRSPPHIPD
jgi:hypothetical protein